MAPAFGDTAGAISPADYQLVTRRVGVLDRSDRGKVLVTGSEAADFLQGQVTNDVEALAPGEGCYACLLTPKGKMRADLRVLRGVDWLWLDTEAIGTAAVLRTIETYSLGRDVRWEDRTETHALLSLIGPAAREGLDVRPPAPEHAHLEGRYGLYVATDLGVDVICEADRADEVRAALGLDEVSAEVADCLRIESGRPRYGVDADEDTIPEEAGLNERAVSFSKGCYVGQETVARLHYKGKPNRHLRGLRLSVPAERDDDVMLGEKVVGRVSSACVSPTEGPIALGLVRREAAPGAAVEVGAGRIPAEVVDLPFGAR